MKYLNGRRVTKMGMNKKFHFLLLEMKFIIKELICKETYNQKSH